MGLQRQQPRVKKGGLLLPLMGLVLLVLGVKFAEGMKSTCAVSAWKMTVNMTLACLFSEDADSQHEQILVYHYPSNDFERGVLVGSCPWKEGKRQCNAVDGYSFYHPITDAVVIETSKHNSGAYRCQKPGRNHDFQNCSLPDDATPGRCPIPVQLTQLDGLKSSCEVKCGNERILLCKFSKSVGEHQYDVRVTHNPADTSYENATVPVLTIHWINHQIHCRVHENYDFNCACQQSELLLIRIKESSPGTYRCQAISDTRNNNDFESCTLPPTDTPRERLEPVMSTPQQDGDPEVTEVPMSSPTRETSTLTATRSEGTINNVLLITLAVGLTVVCIVGIAWIVRNGSNFMSRCRRQDTNQDRTEESMSIRLAD